MESKYFVPKKWRDGSYEVIRIPNIRKIVYSKVHYQYRFPALNFKMSLSTNDMKSQTPIPHILPINQTKTTQFRNNNINYTLQNGLNNMKLKGFQENKLLGLMQFERLATATQSNIPNNFVQYNALHLKMQ